MVVLEVIIIRIFDDSLFVLDHSLVLRVELSSSYVSRSRLSHICFHRFFKCYYLFDWFVDISVTYLEL